MTTTLDDLNHHHGHDQSLRFLPGRGGLTRATLATPATPATTAEVYLHGGHITAWQPIGQEPVLWMSQKAVFAEGQPIRGGVPICFPWFGPKADDPDAPAHGLVRTQAWRVAESSALDDVVHLTLHRAIQGWEAGLTVSVGSSLVMSLSVTNTTDAEQTCEAALHTYLAVGDVRQVHITGLEDTDYLDKVDEAKRKNQGREPIRFTGETDRVYLDTDAACTLHDPVLRRRITVSKRGSRSTVVWNPWVAKAARMADFGDDEWTGMCCIETAAVAGNAITLGPGATHELSATLRVEALA